MNTEEIIELLMVYFKNEIKNHTSRKDNKILITLKNKKIAYIQVQSV